MARSHSILRRYTPPTCTLEIIAQHSALSRWAAKPVVNTLQFQLSLDDPKLPKDDWVVVRGDRHQLAALCEVVSNYVQQFLAQSPDHFNLTIAELDEPEAAIATLPRIASVPTSTEQPASHSFGITLELHGVLNHQLHWGALATQQTGPITQISTLQLFDLANALEDYAADILEMPPQNHFGWIKPFPNWGQIAAMVLVTVGLSTSAVRWLDESNAPAPMTATTSQGASSSDQKIATQLPPAIVEKATPPIISNEKLPPPPIVSSPSPSPGLPTIITPKSPSPNPAAGTVAPETIATYPVPSVPTTPGAPTIITGEVPSAANRSTTRSSAPFAAPVPADAGTNPDTMIAARRGASDETNPPTASAFDTIPQVAEVRTYFEQRWTPPEGLNQILEYSIQISANGSIERISPLRQAAGDYIDRTSMPLIGDTFVSPLKGRQSAKIRVVLEPNGQVRTFLEE